MRAMVIDDSRPIRTILARLLRDVGFEAVEQAENGQEAIDKLNETGCLDLVLVDWNMPVMNGLEFVESVRRDETYDRMPLVMVTTETEMERVERAMSAGANEYVMKPFTKDIVLEKLRLLGVGGEPNV